MVLDKDGFPAVKRKRPIRLEDDDIDTHSVASGTSWRSMVSRPAREAMTGGHIVPNFDEAIKRGVTYFKGSKGSGGGSSSGGSLSRKLDREEFVLADILGSNTATTNVPSEEKPAVEDDEEFVEALAAEIERRTVQDNEREWYENEEGYVVDRDKGGDKSVVSAKREKRMIRYLKSVGKSLFQVDQERWERNRLAAVGFSSDGGSQQAPINEEDYRDYRNVVSVNPNVLPPFLKNVDSVAALPFASQKDIPLLIDPNSDMAQLAKNGSQTLRNLKEQGERTRDKFWQLAGTSMGNVIGLKAEESHQELERSEEKKPLNNLGRSLLASGAPQSREEIERTRARLPVTACKKELVTLIRENPIVVVVGETGSGKTTQLPQILLESGFGGRLLSAEKDVIPPGAFNCSGSSSSEEEEDTSDGAPTPPPHQSKYKYSMIGCTQPRRVAAVSVAKRVAEEQGVDLGQEIGYSIRFEDCTSEKTKIKYMTDAYLLRETLTDPQLERYDVVIMDEAHERSLATDVLLGLLKRLVSSAERGNLKLVITSATMNASLFSQFFGSCPIYSIPGRTYPVAINYLKSVPKDYIEAAIHQCLKIHAQYKFNPEDPSDILVFMTGQEDIEATAYLLSQKIQSMIEDAEQEDEGVKRKPKLDPACVLPIYSTLPADLQSRVFEKCDYRKIIIATNIAETSLTLDGVRYVVDCGLCKVKVYSPQLGMDTLQLTPISRANAQQRAGRAGRTGPGVCFRMFSEQAFYSQMHESQIPEIQRSNLSHVVLLLRSILPKTGHDSSKRYGSLGPLSDVLAFPFLSPPAVESIRQAESQLWMLEALDDDGMLTPMGKRMSGLPVDPSLARMILTAEKLGCVEDILTIVACLSVTSIFTHPKGGTSGSLNSQQDAADSAHEKFFVPESDHMTLMNVYNQWIVHRCSALWAQKHFLQQRALLKVKSVRDQLVELLARAPGSRRSVPAGRRESADSHETAIRKSVASGYFHHAAKLKSLGQYVNLQTSFPCHLHPNSSLILSGSVPQYVVYHEVLLTTKEYMHTVTAIEPDWLPELAPKLYSIKKAGI